MPSGGVQFDVIIEGQRGETLDRKTFRRDADAADFAIAKLHADGRSGRH